MEENSKVVSGKWRKILKWRAGDGIKIRSGEQGRENKSEVQNMGWKEILKWRAGGGGKFRRWEQRIEQFEVESKGGAEEKL